MSHDTVKMIAKIFIFTLLTAAKPQQFKQTTHVAEKNADQGEQEVLQHPLRSPCNHEPIGAIVPQTQENRYLKTFLEFTISDRPTFFIHIPPTSTTEVEFLLRNEDENILIREYIQLTVTNKDTIIAYTLPESFPGLEVGKKYFWRFTIPCSVEPRGSSRFQGLIKKVEPAVEVREQLSNAKTNLHRFYILMKNDYWFDMIKTLHELRAANPPNPYLARTWLSILKSIGLEFLANQPIIKVQSVPPELEL